MQMDANRRIALVTGASRGIGRAIAERLARDGHFVVLNGAGREPLERAAAEIVSGGGQAMAVPADVSDESSVGQMFDVIEARFGRLDILINNAGISPRVDGKKPTVETTPVEHWVRTIAVNLTGPFLVSRAAVPLMRRRGWGRIVNIGSQAGRMNTGFGSAHYSASKAGLLGFSRVLAGEVGEYGITVNCVAPGRIKTDMAATVSGVEEMYKAYIQRTPAGRIGETSDVVPAVAFLVSEEASFITGAIIDITGGFFMP
jgi:NAD(P)-dependent dehydrogenase (short-subunit alcohol dehydrogenase family)